jgi:His/Glu/Gln/Arg/opine family amino acid ABC transporter permease subunit
VISIMRVSRSRLVRIVSTAYVEFFRGTPVLVQLFWIFFCLPIVLGVEISNFASSVIALTLFMGDLLGAIETMMAAARRHGVISAIHMGSVGLLQEWLRKGMGMVMYSSDLGFLMGDSSKGGLERLRSGK